MLNRHTINKIDVINNCLELICLILIYLFSAIVSPRIVYILLTVLLLCYVSVDLYCSYREKRSLAFYSLNSIFLFFQFIVQVCVGNYMPLYSQTHAFPGWEYMVKTMFIMHCAGISFVVGSKSVLSEKIGNKVCKRFYLKEHIDYSVNLKACFGLFFVAVPVYFYGLSQGLLGYQTDVQNTVSSLQQVIVYLSSMMNMAIFMIALDIIKNKSNALSKKMLFVFLLIIKMILALLSGMKADIILLFICLLIIYVVYTGKIRLSLLGIGAFFTVVIYNITSVFRVVLRSTDFRGMSRIQMLNYSMRSIFGSTGFSSDIADSLLSRIGITESCGAVIKYLDKHALTQNDPKFLYDFIMIPLTTFLPRFLFPWKSVLNYGLWVTNVVYGISVYSSSYLTIEGFFYAIGNIFAVIVGFFILAIFLKFISGVLNYRSENEIMFCTFLVLCTSFLFEPNDPVTLMMGILRGIIIFPLMGNLFMNKSLRG